VIDGLSLICFFLRWTDGVLSYLERAGLSDQWYSFITMTRIEHLEPIQASRCVSWIDDRNRSIQDTM